MMLPGCASVPFGLGLIPGAPAYVASILDNAPMAYETAVDERTTSQQMYDAVIAGHAQAELYKHDDVSSLQISSYCYFGKLYLVGEYDSQEQLRAIYEAVNKVEGKRAIISRLYLKEDQSSADFVEEQALWAELEAQLLADYEVTSSPIEVDVIQGNIILLGVISDKEERDRILSHAQSVAEEGLVISYLEHQELTGPLPQAMVAELPPLEPEPAPKAPPVKKKKKKAKPKKKTITKEVEAPASKEQSVAANLPPQPPLQVNGRLLGL